MNLGIAFRVFFKALFDRDVAVRVDNVLRGEPAAAKIPEAERPAPQPEPARPARSEAITLLATLQREARFVDMVKEPLGDYSDAQVGAAARDVLRDCGQVLDRLFQIAPLSEQGEGSEVEVPAGYDAGRIRLQGNVSGEPPFRGQLVHHGWVARKCELPAWSGSQEARLVIAPEEVEIS